jgi:hypothetical protein
MGVAPEAIVEKSFSSIGSRDNAALHTSTRNTSTSRFFKFRYFLLRDSSIRNTLTSRFFNSRYFLLRDSSTRNTLTSRFFNSKYFNFENNSPQGYNQKNSSHMILFINSAFVGIFLFSFYDVNEDVALYQCGPLYGYYCNFHHFLTV